MSQSQLMNLQSNIHLQLKQVVNETSPEQVKDDSKVKCLTEPDLPKCEVCSNNSQIYSKTI